MLRIVMFFRGQSFRQQADCWKLFEQFVSSYLFSRCSGLMSGLQLTCLLVFLNVSECLTVSMMLDCIESCSCFTNYI